MEEITITRDDFRKAVSEELGVLINTKGGDSSAGVLAGILCATFGAALTRRLFKKDEEDDE